MTTIALLDDTETSAVTNREFSRGSDARLRGLPLAMCPHQSSSEVRYVAWREGWLDCDSHWGVDVKGRWLHPQLPRVKQTKE